MSSPAFDAAAADYDRSFTDLQPGRWFRDAVWSILNQELDGKDRVLDLGCGTGEDAVHLARLGKTVHAVDISPAMVDVARAKALLNGCREKIACRVGDISDLRLDGEEPFDGLVSNFGPLNCIENLDTVATLLATWLRPGGTAVLVIMGPWCPWEIGWYLLHGHPRAAFRRLRRGLDAPVGDGPETIPVWYHTPRSVRRAVGPDFIPVRLVGLGSLLPPPYLHGLVARWPRLFGCLASLERRVAAFFPFNRWCDHYALVLRRAE